MPGSTLYGGPRPLGPLSVAGWVPWAEGGPGHHDTLCGTPWDMWGLDAMGVVVCSPCPRLKPYPAVGLVAAPGFWGRVATR